MLLDPVAHLLQIQKMPYKSKYFYTKKSFVFTLKAIKTMRKLAKKVENILHTHEVTGSSPVVSTKNTPKTDVFGVFFCVLRTF